MRLKKTAIILAVLMFCLTCFACKGGSGGVSGGSTGSDSISGSEEISDGLKELDSADHEHEYMYVKTVAATCDKEGVKAHYKCKICGIDVVNVKGKFYAASAKSLATPKKQHSFTMEVADEKYLVSDATYDMPRVYKKSCVCGMAPGEGEYETFTAGKALKEYDNADKSLYTPTSLTMTLYDAANCVYGFTWNTNDYPAMPVVTYSESESLKSDATEVMARTEEAKSFAYSSSGDVAITYYVSKAEVKLKPNTVYTYKVEDKYLGTATKAVTIKTLDATANKVKFSHVSDSQAGDVPNGTGKYFKSVLGAIEKGGSDFIIHTGDVVEYSKYESFWKEMLDGNFDYLSKIPIMAISGNHETTYKNGNNETYKHFNYKIPEQQTDKGFYYSFSYADIRFVMLNTNLLAGGCITDAQYKWLRNELSEKTEKWTIVTLHNPIYSVGKWGADESRNGIALSLRSQLGDLFAESGVDVVLQGHDHCVSRTFPIGKNGVPATEKTVDIGGISYIENPEGVLYVMNGPAGNQTRTVFKNDETLYAYAMGSSVSSWADFEIVGDNLTVTVKTAYSGVVKDIVSWGIKKSA